MALKKIRLGDLLVQHDFITTQQLEQAIAHQKQEGGKLGKVLISLGYLSEKDFLDVLSEQLDIPYIDLINYEVEKSVTQKLPEMYARRFRALVLKDQGDALLVGLVDPLDIHAYDELSRFLKCKLSLALVKESALLKTINLVYRHREELAGAVEALSDQLRESEFDINQFGEGVGTQEAPVVKLLQTIFKDAVQVGASDIHIEPGESELRIRVRVDGRLQEQVMPEHHIAPALVQRLKLMAGLNIAERRLPQDGRFSIRVLEHALDIRLSTMPATTGETVVLRILDQSAAQLDLEQLGIPSDILQALRRIIHQPHGMLLVTGPTGSGKTTTLYSILNELNTQDKKIITVEDPVEYRMSRINQVQVNTAIDLSFARVLRTALRHDPDILLVGEIRDHETATIALRAAITGHMVFATLHTNDALSSAMRLVDMGVEGYMVATAVEAVISQRLIRKICEHCSEPYQPTIQEQTWLESAMINQNLPHNLQMGKGCTQCNHTGYQGRVGIYELLELDHNMLHALREQNHAAFVEAANNRDDTRPLGLRALELASQGVTTVDEVLRVAGAVEEDYHLTQ